MLICNERNFLLCDPECPHGKPHEAEHDLYETSRGKRLKGYCNDIKGLCRLRADQPMVRCVEVKQ